MRSRLLTGILLAGALASAGCKSDVESLIASETWGSRLQVGGSAWRSVTLNRAGEVTLQLTSLPDATVTLELGYGTISGSSCQVVQSVQTTPTTVTTNPQLTVDLAVGTYCVQVRDIGNLTAVTTDFTVLITYPYKL